MPFVTSQKAKQQSKLDFLFDCLNNFPPHSSLSLLLFPGAHRGPVCRQVCHSGVYTKACVCGGMKGAAPSGRACTCPSSLVCVCVCVECLEGDKWQTLTQIKEWTRFLFPLPGSVTDCAVVMFECFLCRLCLQLGDEDCILPSKLQAALQQILEERENILSHASGDSGQGLSHAQRPDQRPEQVTVVKTRTR